MSNNNGKGREIFYGVIGVATLVVAIIGATFAYFTASATNNTAITGNAASINFGLAVARAETNDTAGLIPMSNNMVEAAVSDASGNGVCVDDNNNAVCQVYSVTVTNNSSANIFLDGYVNLDGGLSTPDEFSDLDGVAGDPTTDTGMRWAQVFCTGEADTLECSTAGNSTVATSPATVMTSIDAAEDDTGYNQANILTTGVTTQSAITGAGTTTYDIINKNYIRISGHTDGETYTHADDVASALVFNQNLGAQDAVDDSDEVVLYFVVWLSESGTNQNPEGAEGTAGQGFFTGSVTFISAAGSEVSASFNGYTRVAPTDTASPDVGA